MSWWNAKYKNAHGEYEITFGSKYKEKTKIVEKVCKWIIDKLVQSEDDITIVRHGQWVFVEQRFYHGGFVNLFRCSECSGATDREHKYCPNCGARMQKEPNNV